MKSLRLPLLVLFVYAFVLPWLPGLRSPGELSRLYLARALVEDRTVALDRQVARDGTIGDLAHRGEHAYAKDAPGVSFVGAGVYAVLRAAHRGGGVGEREAIFWLRLVACMVPMALAAELLRRILARRFDPQLASAGAVVFALGSLAWPYSVLLMGEGPAAAAVVGCWWAIERAAAERHGARWLALAGLLGGTAMLLDYASALALAPLGVWAIGAVKPRARAALGALLGLLPPVLLLALYHHVAFGHPLQAMLALGTPTLAGLRASFVDPGRGLFAWAPFLALGVPGLVALWRMDRSLAVLCMAELLVQAWHAAGADAAWGWTVGQPQLVVLCAFLVPPAVAAADQLRRAGLGFLPAGLALFGLAVLALTLAVGPYLPDDLTNPVHQLVLPLARRGLRSPDLLGLALHARSWWTLLPWVAALALAAAALVPLSTVPGDEPGAMTSALAGALAALLFAGHSHLGGADRFEDTRQFMREQYGCADGQVPGIRSIGVRLGSFASSPSTSWNESLVTALRTKSM